jgi:hypothetical protein
MDAESVSNSDDSSSSESELGRPAIALAESDDDVFGNGSTSSDRIEPFYNTEVFLDSDTSKLSGSTPQFLPYATATSHHHQLCQMVVIDETDEACIRGDRLYYLNGTVVYAVDVELGSHMKLVDLGFSALNLHANHRMVAAVGNGEQCVVVDGYTGELLFSKDRMGLALTNTVRIFVASPRPVAIAAALADYADSTDDERTVDVPRPRVAKEQPHVKRIEGKVTVSERLKNENVYLLLGGNSDGVSVLASNDGRSVAYIPCECCGAFTRVV